VELLKIRSKAKQEKVEEDAEAEKIKTQIGLIIFKG
jgi:hypothetical protein